MYMNKFVYVFDEKTKEQLLVKGFKLLKSDIKNKIFVFENNAEVCFEFSNIQHILSNTLTF